MKVCGFFDGSCEPINPGGTAAYGWIFYGDGMRVERSGVVGKGNGMTNNVAEYAGLLSLLRWLDGNIGGAVEVFGDSKMVVEMAASRWGKKKPHRGAPHLLPWLTACREILARHHDWTVEWIPREENGEADALSTAAEPQYRFIDPSAETPF